MEKEILSHMSLELRWFLHAVDHVEAGRFAVERGCCAKVHGEAVHTSHGMNSKWNSSFHYRNSYKLINAIWVYTCDTVAHLRHVPALTEHRLHLLKIPNISLGHGLHMQCLPPPSSLGTVRNESGPHPPYPDTIRKSDVIFCHSPAPCYCYSVLYLAIV